MTVVLITHFMEEAAIADRVVVMNHGVIALDDTPSKIFSQVEKIKELGLDVPQVTELVFELKKQGIDLPGDIITIDECHRAILEKLKKGDKK